MRLNKKRLAALAMSAVMAASAVPFPVYAEELSAGDAVVETTVETPEVAADSITWEYVENSAKWYYNGENDFGVKFQKKNAADSSQIVDDVLTQAQGVTAVVKEAANCGHGVVVDMTATILGKVMSGTYTDDKTVGEHVWAGRQSVVQDPTCGRPGVVESWDECTVCGKTTEKKVQSVPATGKHTFDESKGVEYKNFNNAELKDGKPVVLDPTKGASYDVHAYCTVCGKIVFKETVKIPAAAVQFARVKAGSTEGLVTTVDELNKLGGSDASSFKIDEKKIELKDCDVAGSYVVEYLDSEQKVLSEEKIVVNPHHYNTKKVAVFKTKADALNASVKEEKDGSLTVTSNSCVDTVEYTEVTFCAASGCKAGDLDVEFVKDGENTLTSSKRTIKHVTEKVAKKAEATGKHVINSDIKTAIDEYIKDNKAIDIEEIEKIVGDSKEVTLDVPAEVCEKGGEVTVNYICVLDKKTVVETQKFNVIASGHTKTDVPVKENTVAATCEHRGSFDNVTYCKRCNKELSRVKMTLPRLKHSNEANVDVNGVGEDDYATDKTATVKFIGDVVVDPGYNTYKVGTNLTSNYVNQNTGAGKQKFAGYDVKTGKLGVYTQVFTNCTECNNHEVRLADWRQEAVTLKVKDVQQDKNGRAGYIVLEATYTKTNDENKVITAVSPKIPYYSSLDAYNGRVEPESKNGLYKDEDGKYRYYVDGVFQKDTTGVINFAGNKFVVVNGVLINETNGLWYDEATKTWYFLSEGQVRTDYSGTALYDGEWFYVSNGKLNEAVNGLVAYNGGTFLFTEGRLRTDVSGLWQDINSPEDWYYLALGQVQTNHSGVVQYDGGFFVVKEGKFDKTYNGKIKYDGKEFKVVNGQLITK